MINLNKFTVFYLLQLISYVINNLPVESHLLCASYQVPDYLSWDGSYVPMLKCGQCKSGFILIDGQCYCPEGTFFNIDSVPAFQCIAVPSAVNCISGVYKTGALNCTACGYGTKLNPTTRVC